MYVFAAIIIMIYYTIRILYIIWQDYLVMIQVQLVSFFNVCVAEPFFLDAFGNAEPTHTHLDPIVVICLRLVQIIIFCQGPALPSSSSHSSPTQDWLSRHIFRKGGHVEASVASYR